ncbi:hypothetical protein AVEN_265721-1 [Araneus ventricosus]|uniref:Uncharacterized protein n=1 Tax=Araneus ventricosus TaxID=182803 RepID=A0A4Y2FM94_ARAVE|nr:hypothetical protein AVEN_265721-1 [Araneus ventricosus]
MAILGPCNFEQWSDDGDIVLSKLIYHVRGKMFDPPRYALALNKPNTRWIIGEIGFRTWKPFGLEVGTLPLDHCGPHILIKDFPQMDSY